MTFWLSCHVTNIFYLSAKTKVLHSYFGEFLIEQTPATSTPVVGLFSRGDYKLFAFALNLA
jgi:hypothetical protein